ncbi:hypothetical protein MKW94_018792, partial [Papaver nudicaule]|nr:hypothetical protein [Papaver nudicaule]
MNTEREKLVYFARLAEQAERYDGKGNEQNARKIKEYRQKFEDELSKICSDFLVVIDEHLLSSSYLRESTVFYHKMKGDYYRYLAEIKFGDEREEVADMSLKAYEV